MVDLVCHAERTGNQFPDQGAKIVSLGAGGPPAQGPCISWVLELVKPAL